MALSGKSLFLYGFQVTENNRCIDFRAVSAETPRMATLKLGFYSLTALAKEIARAMKAVDALRTYAVTVDRTIAGGMQNRVSITSSGDYFQLLFSSGPRATSACNALIGFNPTDYTGSTAYTGAVSAGLVLVPSMTAYNYLGPEFNQELFGNVNVSASGVKEAIVFNVQQFMQAEFRYEPRDRVINDWQPLMQWCIQQRLLEFTPLITESDTFYECTLDKSESNGKGLGFKMSEMLPQFPNIYKTGLLTFRVNS